MVLSADNDIDDIIDSELDNAEMLGYDTDDIDPELMGGLIANIIARVKAAREKRAAGGTPSTGLSITTSAGTGSINDQGISFLRPQTGGGIMQQGGIFDQLKENPMLAAIPAGLILILLLKRK